MMVIATKNDPGKLTRHVVCISLGERSGSHAGFVSSRGLGERGTERGYRNRTPFIKIRAFNL